MERGTALVLRFKKRKVISVTSKVKKKKTLTIDLEDTTLLRLFIVFFGKYSRKIYYFSNMDKIIKY